MWPRGSRPISRARSSSSPGRSPGARVALWIVVVVCGLALGLSRIALGVHFVTDVAAGWCFGLAWLAA